MYSQRIQTVYCIIRSPTLSTFALLIVSLKRKKKVSLNRRSETLTGTQFIPDSGWRWAAKCFKILGKLKIRIYSIPELNVKNITPSHILKIQFNPIVNWLNDSWTVSIIIRLSHKCKQKTDFDHVAVYFIGYAIFHRFWHFVSIIK